MAKRRIQDMYVEGGDELAHDDFGADGDGGDGGAAADGAAAAAPADGGGDGGAPADGGGAPDGGDGGQPSPPSPPTGGQHYHHHHHHHHGGPGARPGARGRGRFGDDAPAPASAPAATLTQDMKTLEKKAEATVAKPVGFFSKLFHSIFGGEVKPGFSPNYPRSQVTGYPWGGGDRFEPDMAGEFDSEAYLGDKADFPIAPLIGADVDGTKYKTGIKG